MWAGTVQLAGDQDRTKGKNGEFFPLAVLELSIPLLLLDFRISDSSLWDFRIYTIRT
jgi:hypothetical protein